VSERQVDQETVAIAQSAEDECRNKRMEDECFVLIFVLMPCSVQFSVAAFYQTTSKTNFLLCLAEVARLPLEVSSYHVYNWCYSWS